MQLGSDRVETRDEKAQEAESTAQLGARRLQDGQCGGERGTGGGAAAHPRASSPRSSPDAATRSCWRPAQKVGGGTRPCGCSAFCSVFTRRQSSSWASHRAVHAEPVVEDRTAVANNRQLSLLPSTDVHQLVTFIIAAMAVRRSDRGGLDGCARIGVVLSL